MHRNPRRWLVSHLLRRRWLLLAFLLLSLAHSVLAAAMPRLTGVAFDVVLHPDVVRFGLADPGSQLGALAGGMLVLALFLGATDIGSAFAVEVVAQRLERDARDELYVALLGKSQTFHQRQKVGDIMARATNDVRQLNPMLNPGASLILSSMLGIVVPVTFIALLDPRLLLAPALFLVAYAVSLRRYMAELGPVSFAIRARFGTLNAGLTETITGIEVVKSVVSESWEKRRFVENAASYRDAFVDQGRIQARYLPVLFIGLAIALGFAQGAWMVSVGQLSPGELVGFMGLMGMLRFPAFISIFTFTLVQLGLAASARVLEMIVAETELDENAGGHTAPVTGEVRFERVSFAYQGDKRVLSDVSFTVPPGRTVAIVGQTGSGKSTLTRLVNRTYDATGGRILVDGVDVRDWDLHSLRSQISVIEQDVFLFSRSIRDNIAFGLGDRATPEAIEAAARAAQAHDFITRFADGYDTVVGERGVTLSGGQRQRIAIARALLTDPRILVLDDSTSAIDSATEDAIQRAIGAVLAGRTTFVITHRLAQIRRADHVIVLAKGGVLDQGTHEELLGRCALYQRIFGARGEVSCPS
ncbi:MAG: ABC transporter ATP-binding protein [Myxococcales bacterium]|nr:ABC transporter ATP-binding protein [Myxococcales bacterium]